MATFHHTYSSKLVAAVIFSMTFLLTPRVMIDPVDSFGATSSGVHDMIPVQTLQEPEGDCLWCEPLQPVRCEEAPAPEGDESLQRPGKKLWLNPDEPPTTSPCVPLQESPEPIEDGPSA